MNGDSGMLGAVRATGKLRPGAGQGPESEVHQVRPWRNGHGAKQDVGAQKVRRLAVNLGEPPGMPQVVQHHPAAGGAVGLNHHFRVAVGEDARLSW